MYRWDTLVLLKHYLDSGLSKAAIARQLGLSRGVIYHWLRTGQLERDLSAPPVRRPAPRPTKLERYHPLIQERLTTYPELSAVRLFAECRAAGYAGGYYLPAHLFVFTLGYSRRLYATAFPHERLDAVLEGHEQAFRHFDGVPAQIVVDNAKPTVLHHGRDAVVWHPTCADFAGYYGFHPWAHWPYRPQTKGKVEAGVKYVKRNGLAGKRFGSWTHLNDWLLEWATTIADVRVHGTTHEIPLVRFAQEHLTPLGRRPPYGQERVRHRLVPADALVAIAGSRYSVPVRYVGTTVVIRELAGSYEILAGDAVIARHPRLARHRVAMEPAHYAGLLRPPGLAPPPAPPRWDPGYPAEADVEVRDLACYAALVEAGV